MANGKQTKSVQVAEWMGRHEAWSAEKPSDPRTKPTRWEFHNGREQSSENIEEATQVRPAYNSNPNRIRSAGERSKNIKIRNFGVTKDDTHLSFHNSRTNLINDPDLYVEDINNAEYEGDTLQQIKIRRHQPEQRKTYDVDSIQHHDIERGSDIDVNTARSTMKNNREFFIKDGNIEILHLMTRDKAREGVNLEDENIYINVPPRNLNLSQKPILMVENSGKEILMRRFIEEQPDGKQIIREHYQIVPGATYIQNLPNEIIQNSTLKGETFPLGKSGPNSIVYSQAEPEVKVIHTQHAQDDREPKRNALVTDSQLALSNQSLSQELENTLKQQNELLRQILLEKTRYTQNDLGLETQSLPGNSIAIATQTDCEVGTQTDGLNGFSAQTLTKRRKARSENDDSVSEDDYEFVRFTPPNSPEGVYFIKRRRQKRRPKTKEGTRSSKRVVMVEEIKRKIRTPIREEEEVQVVRKRSPPKKPLRETKTSILRRNKNEERKRSIEKNNGKGTLSDNILAEISDSFDERNSSDEHKNYKFRVDQVQFCSNTENTSGNDIYYDSDPDEIVIRTNSLLPTQDQRKTKENKEKHNFEIHINEKLSNIVSKTPGTTQHYETKPEAKLRLSRKYRSNESLTGHAQKMRKSSIEQTQDRPSMSKYYSNGSNSSSKSSFQKQTNSLKDRAHQSETDLTEQQEMHEKSRNVPKYMDWYYNKKTQQKNDHSPVVTSNQVSNKKKSENSSEKVVSKSSMNTQQKDSSAENLKFKPEPAPRKSPPKVNNLLKEDMKVSKQLTSQVEIDTNHPLLQHSEHRFERENTHDVPIPPTNLPHYMYPETPPLASSKNSTVIEKPSPIKENEIKHSKINSNTTVQLQENQSSKFQSNAHKQLCAATLEDDHDSGIAMNSLFNSFSRRNPIADKKSVFTIAYDDVRRVKKITSGGESPQNS